jgi:hypothetical protein
MSNAGMTMLLFVSKSGTKLESLELNTNPQIRLQSLKVSLIEFENFLNSLKFLIVSKEIVNVFVRENIPAFLAHK